MNNSSAFLTTDEIMNKAPVNQSARDLKAGYTSLFAEGDPVGEVYFQTLEEDESLGHSPTTAGVNNMLHQEEQQQMVEQLPDILIDENLNDDFKQEAVNTAFNPARPENTMAYQYALETLGTPDTSEESNSEYKTLRERSLNSLNRITEYREMQQAVADKSNISKEQGLSAAVLDFGMMMLMFYDGANAAELNNAIGSGDVNTVLSFLFPGSGTKNVKEAFQKMPLDVRMEIAPQLVDLIESVNSNSFMTNRISAQNQLDAVLYGDYTDLDAWVDNFFGLLDATIVGKPIAWAGRATKAAKAGKAAEILEEIEAGVEANQVRTDVSPTSPVRIESETNAAVTREHVADIALDETEESSRALTGTSTEEAIADTLMPEVKVSGQGLRSKVYAPTAEADKAVIKNPVMKEIIDEASIGVFTKKDLETANAHVVERLQEATGVTSRKEMFQVQPTEVGSKIKGVYGPTEGGWSDAQEAIELVHLATRGEGIAKEDLHILQRADNGEYHQVEGVPKESGDYLVGFDYNYDIRMSDITSGNWESLSVAKNLFNRTAIGTKFNVDRHLLDAASMMHPHLTLGANVAVDKSARAYKALVDQAMEYTTKLRGLNKEQGDRVSKYIKEANEKELEFKPTVMKADWGMTDKEIDAIRTFRAYWDDIWAIRNRLDATKMRDEGYMILENSSTDTRLFGKPRSAQFVDINKMVFDPNTEDFRHFSKEELKTLEESGGGIIQMRKPMEFSGIVTDYVLYNKADNIRGVSKEDIVYPYRPGYYEVKYDAPHFIVKEVTDGNTTYHKAVATANTMKDADLYIQRMAKTDPKGVYVRRGDLKDRAELAGFELDTYEVYGRTSSRVRGKRLENATAIVNNIEQSNIKGPVDSMIESARNMGNYASMSTYLNASKQRFMDQYKDLLPKENGMVRYPQRVEDIGHASGAMSKQVADARSTYQYISSLETTAVNSLDSFYKASMRAAAEAIGGRGWDTAERAVRAVGEVPVQGIVKSAAYQAYIVWNPLRQFLLNAHQMVTLLPNFTSYMVNPKGMVAETTAFLDLAMSGGKNLKTLSKLTNRTESELRFMYKEFQKTGLADSIDSHNMFRGALMEYTENAGLKGSAVARGIAAVEKAPRKAGFEAGEWVNLAISWLAHYDKAAQGKKALTKTELHEVGARARNYTMNMNRAGDMPYNQNALSLILQFAQVPHKALLAFTTNRVLSKGEKIKLGVFSVMGATLPATAMYQWFGDILPDRQEHPELHDVVVQGIEFYTMNRIAEAIMGDDSDIDYSSLAPMDAYGLYDMIHGILTTEISSLISESPAGSLFLGDNPRITNFFRTVARFATVEEDFKDDLEMSDVFKEFANISSGWSNAQRAAMAWEYGKMYNRKNVVTDPKVTKPEAMAKLFGFSTMEETRLWASVNQNQTDKKAIRKEVKQYLSSYMSLLANKGATTDDLNYHVKVMSQGLRMYRDNPVALEIWNDEFSKQIALQPSAGIYNNIMRMSGVLTLEEVESRVKNAPDFDPDSKQSLLNAIENMRTEGRD